MYTCEGDDNDSLGISVCMGIISGFKHLHSGEPREHPKGTFLNRHLILDSAASVVPPDITVQHPFQMREGI